MEQIPVDAWKTLMVFTYPHEAHVAQSFLKSEGIDCVLVDEMTVQVHNFYSNAIGGIKLQVRESAYAEGLKILKKGAYAPSESISQEVVRLSKADHFDREHCPFCQSANISINRKPKVLMVVVFVISGILFPFLKRSYTCFDCGRQWKFVRNKT
ncbi:putative signal transducing protein [Sunxiuqinia sp. sy24]|uniref:putative signal transducing protein n=1 Tax=Sunxiuqinia sp. sy24 TaxID=3461495 RepID=UPI0040466E17